MMYWNDGSWGWAGWLTMIVMMVAFWGLVAWLAVMLVRATTRSSSGGPGDRPRSDPQEVLADRFARGEIDEEEYRRRADVLRSTSTGPR